MKEMKRDGKKSDKIKALNLVPQKALHVFLQSYTTKSTVLITLITKLWLSPSAKQQKSSFWAPTCVPRFEYMP